MAEQHSAAVVQLQTALREATDKLDGLKSSAEQDKAEIVAKLQDDERVIAELKQQVEDANKLLEQTKQGMYIMAIYWYSIIHCLLSLTCI